VKECIIDFRNAGISVWMLTGDKGLTAKEIGVSCGLVPHDAEYFDANDKTTKTGDDTKNKCIIFSYDETLDEETEIFELTQKYMKAAEAYRSYIVLISGVTM